MEILSYHHAGFPAVAVHTVEEERFIAKLTAALQGLDPAPSCFMIAAAGGLINLQTRQVLDAGASYPKAFQYLTQQDNAILIVLDFHHVAKNPAAYRHLRLALPACKQRGNLIILLAPQWQLPAELEHEIPILDFPLPTREELRGALEICLQAAREVLPDLEITDEQQRSALDAAKGLTFNQAENVFALAAKDRFTPRPIEQEKLKILRQTGFMHVAPPNDPAAVGGLDGIKTYFETEVIPVKDDPDLWVKGIVLVGVPGTGKSLCARTAGAWLGWPVVRLDLAACKGSLVGQTEQNVRKGLAIADAIAPCVLWLDEIEKAIGGHASSAATDSGVTLGMVGALLTWMQEHESQILVMATCNDYQALPAEFTRAGRFDERFFVDLPDQHERAAIAAIHLRRYQPNGQTEALAQTLATLTEHWTGAEIEQCVKSAARRTRRQITKSAIHEAAALIRPLAQTKGPEIHALRQWAQATLRFANRQAETPAGRHERKIAVR